MYGTDRQLMCCIEEKLFNEPILISSEMGELLQLLEGDKVNVEKEGNRLAFETENISIYGPELEGIDIYPVQSIQNVINLQYNNMIKVNKQSLLGILERIEIFITPYDKNGAYLDFIDNKLSITSQKSNATEELEVVGDVKTFNCLVDVIMLKNVIQNIQGEDVMIYYGQDRSMLIKENDISYVLCLLEKSNQM